MPFHRHYAKKLFAHLAPGVRQAGGLYYLGNLRFHFDLHEQCLEAPEAWPMPCTAGETSIVIDHNGTLSRVRDARHRGRSARFRFRRAAGAGVEACAAKSVRFRGELLVHAQLLHPGQLQVLAEGATPGDSARGAARRGFPLC